MAGIGYYKGYTSISLGLAHHENNDFIFQGEFAYNKHSHAILGAGLAYRFDHKNDIADLNDKDTIIVLRRRLMEQNNTLVEQDKRIEEQSKQIQELKAMVEKILNK